MLYLYISLFFQENFSESSHKRDKIPKIIKTARYRQEFNTDPYTGDTYGADAKQETEYTYVNSASLEGTSLEPKKNILQLVLFTNLVNLRVANEPAGA